MSISNPADKSTTNSVGISEKPQHVEWGIQYLDENITMAGHITITTTVRSEEDARRASTWTHGSWGQRDVRVVKRLVTEWETA